ncbi:hypothetical protein ACOME3_001479 [Neoechinorhynchus agilis]
MDESFDDVTAEAKILCHQMISQLKSCLDLCFHESHTKINGIQRLERRLLTEQRFLESLLDKENVPLSRVYSSNCTNLCAIAERAFSIPNTESVLKPFKLKEDKIVVDIVTNDSWIKIISRNAQSVHLIWAGACKQPQKSVVTIIEEYFEAANLHVLSFQRQRFKIVAHFSKGVTASVANALEHLGAVVEDTEKPGYSLDEEDEECSDGERPKPINLLTTLQSMDIDDTRVNLDVTTMTCFISELTNGVDIPVFDSEYHEIPASQERARRLLPILQGFIGHKKMIACKAAIELMESIVESVGGPKEKRRFDDLLKKIEVVENDPSDRALALVNSNRISDRSKVIFGTGDKLRVVTMTSNWGFVRAAQLQGIVFVVWEHDSFPLTMNRFLNQLRRRRLDCPIIHKTREVFMESVVIDRTERGKGRGRLMLNMIENELRKEGFTSIILKSRNARGFYERCGYRPCEPIAFYLGEPKETVFRFGRINTHLPDDGTWMCKSLS